MKNTALTTIIITIIVGALAFYGGMKYQQKKATALRGQFGQLSGRGDGNRAGRNAVSRPVAGEILSIDDKSMTIKLPDASSKIVLLSNSTVINKAVEGSRGDLQVGTKVAAFGTDNSDGSLTASNIQINPMLNGSRGSQTSNQQQKSPDAKEIVVTGKNYEFSPNQITVKKGEKTRIVFKNTEGMHDFKVDELNIATSIVGSGQEDFVEFTPDKTGTFEFYCSVGTHRAMGMKGTLVVE